MPVVEIIKLGDSRPEPFKRAAARPLSDLKVLDCTHVIAGPTCAKTLASQRAEVLHITCPSRPRLPPFDTDTSHGKLSAFLDLKIAKDNHRMRDPVKDADVFSQSYRPGKLTSLGFSPHPGRRSDIEGRGSLALSLKWNSIVSSIRRKW